MLIEVVNDPSDQGFIYLLVLLEHSAGLDTTDHTIPLDRLSFRTS